MWHQEDRKAVLADLKRLNVAFFLLVKGHNVYNVQDGQHVKTCLCLH